MSKKNDGVGALRGKFEKAISSFNSGIDKLPEALRAPWVEARGNLQNILDELPGAEDASVEQLSGTVSRLTDFYAGVTSSLNQLSEKINAQQTSLNKLTELEKQITDGELVPKAKALELAKSARAEGEQQAQARFAKISKRRDAIAKAGIPVPGDDALEVEDAEFTTREATAKKRFEELKGRGLSLNSVFAASVWASEDIYKRDLALFDEGVKSKGGGNPFGSGSGGGGGGAERKGHTGLC